MLLMWQKRSQIHRSRKHYSVFEQVETPLLEREGKGRQCKVIVVELNHRTNCRKPVPVRQCGEYTPNVRRRQVQRQCRCYLETTTVNVPDQAGLVELVLASQARATHI